MISLKATVFRLHRFIAWVGGIALMCFAISAILHPVMSWTGPQAVQHTPPEARFTAQNLEQTQAILRQHQFKKIRTIKLVPGPDQGLLMQVTNDRSQVRQYFNVRTGAELLDYEPTYARWLAGYYTGLKTNNIVNLQHQTQFDAAYPWVNRLLPVYRVEFADAAKTIAFVDTELGALAGLTNTYKSRLQILFQWMHTWSWLGADGVLRFLVVLVFVLSIVTMLGTGLNLILRVKRQKPSRTQRWHRFVGIGLWLPLSFFALSGLYHLLQNQVVPPQHSFQSLPAFKLNLFSSKSKESLATPKIDGFFSSISILNLDHLVYRVTQAPVVAKGDRESRFQGHAIEGKSDYYSVSTGKYVDLSEEELARRYATLHLANLSSEITGLELLTQFGSGYDFRNKRLPVWRVLTSRNEVLFIDNATGALVDRTTPSQSLENLSFSYLHKYNFLTPILGRFYRDLVMILIVGMAIALSLLGYWLVIKRR